MNNLLKEAIADAKAVRETALANAKLALEEAFTPRLQSMLSAKLSEDEEMEMEEDEDMAEVPAEEPMEAPVPEAPVEDPAVAEGEYEGEEEVSEEEELDVEPVAEEEEEDLELEAILRELEDEGETEPEPVAEGEDEEAVEEQSDSSDIGKSDNKVDAADSGDEQDPGKGDLTEDEEEVDLEEIINALREEEGDEETVEEDQDTAGVDDGAAADLEEAYKVIRFMKSKLNEVNLLNAKLLFSNKLFRNHNLNESQKMKVIENFDRAQSMREVKLVFATLTESFKFGRSTKVKTIKESYASRPTRTTRPNKSILSEGNTLANRWKKLAGLNG